VAGAADPVIAVQLYTLRSLLKDAATVAGVLGRIREIGYQSVEVAGLGDGVAGRFGEELRRSGLKACAAHASLDRLHAQIDAVARECMAWGCEYVVVPSLPELYRSHQGFRRFAAEAADLAARLAGHGIQLAYHNHAYELQRFDGATGLDTLLASTDAQALAIELDTYWLQFGGANPATWIRRCAGRAPLVHLKDMAIVNGDPVDAPIGEGNLDWTGILSACRAAGTRWLVVEQDAPRGDPLEAVATSYRNLETLLARAQSGGDDA
jgi:sugar phosphate isomerase/epimerase